MSRLGIAAGLAAALAMSACTHEPDVEKLANGALDSVALNDEVDASYDSDARVVHLSGSVDRPEDRTRADDAVRASVEGFALVANQIVVQNPDEDPSGSLDQQIEASYDTLWMNTPELRDTNIDMAVDNGVVTLEGSVTSATLKKRVESMVRDIPGVHDVVNALAVTPESRRLNRQP